jgi:predicted AAA+ superfamily ATPase
VLHELPAWRRSGKRKPLVSSKYYFFDIGVTAELQGREFRPGTPEFGEAFETWLFHELRCYSDYISSENLGYWRSTSGFEVDFILGDHTAIEVKAKENVSTQDLKSLRALAEEKKLKRYLCISLDPRPRTLDGINILPYRKFLNDLWIGAYL